MRLAILVDPIAIAARVTIILMAADHGANDSAGDRADRRARASADARENRAGKGSSASADRRSSRCSCNLVVVSWCGSAAA
jgi:hypothetical protein